MMLRLVLGFLLIWLMVPASAQPAPVPAVSDQNLAAQNAELAQEANTAKLLLGDANVRALKQQQEIQNLTSRVKSLQEQLDMVKKSAPPVPPVGGVSSSLPPASTGSNPVPSPISPPPQADKPPETSIPQGR